MEFIGIIIIGIIAKICIDAENEKKKFIDCPVCGTDGRARIRVIRNGKEVVQIIPNEVCGACLGRGKIRIKP